MAINPLAWQTHTYVGQNGTEKWRVDCSNPGAFVCDREGFAREADIEEFHRLMVAANNARSDEQAAGQLEAQANALITLQLHQVFAFNADAITFFADGREDARHEAHDLVASVDNTLGNFQTGQ